MGCRPNLNARDPWRVAADRVSELPSDPVFHPFLHTFQQINRADKINHPPISNDLCELPLTCQWGAIFRENA
jgi:hypothetical protein